MTHISSDATNTGAKHWSHTLELFLSSLLEKKDKKKCVCEPVCKVRQNVVVNVVRIVMV